LRPAFAAQGKGNVLTPYSVVDSPGSFAVFLLERIILNSCSFATFRVCRPVQNFGPIQARRTLTQTPAFLRCRCQPARSDSAKFANRFIPISGCSDPET
jgi:hypothetical protein